MERALEHHTTRDEAGTVLVVRGRIVGAGIVEFGAALETLLRSDARRCVLDLRGVEEWSLVAQAMVVASARKKAARGEQLVLRGASESLRAQSRLLDVFEQVAHPIPAGEPWDAPATKVGGASRPPARRVVGRG